VVDVEEGFVGSDEARGRLGRDWNRRAQQVVRSSVTYARGSNSMFARIK
jgi:hypothetical protein